MQQFSNRIASYCCLVRHGIWKKPMVIISFLAPRGIDLALLTVDGSFSEYILNVTLCNFFGFQIILQSFSFA
jgi:hypothetical protein